MKPKLAKALLEACLQVYRRRLWDRVPGDTPIELRVAGEEFPLLAVVMGQAGREFGVILHRGPRAAELFAAMLTRKRMATGTAGWDFLSATVEPWGSLPERIRHELQKLGFRARREQPAPFLIAKRAHADAHFPRAAESELLLTCLNALLALDERGELQRSAFAEFEDRMLRIDVEGSAYEPHIDTRWAPRPEAFRAIEGLGFETLEDGDEEPPTFAEMLGGEPRLLDETWWAGRIDIGGGPLRVQQGAWAVVRLEDGFLRATRMVPLDLADGDGPQGIQLAFDTLIEAAHRDGPEPGLERGLPRELQLGGRDLLEEFGPELGELGIRTRNVPRPPAIVATLVELLAEALRTAPAPAPDDLLAWKAAELKLMQHVLVPMVREIPSRLRSRFFGGADAAREALQPDMAESTLPALAEWYFAEHRATPRSSTALEKLLAGEEISPAWRALLEARRDARLSFYVVRGTEPGSSLDLECLIDGSRWKVHDRALSGCAPLGCVLVLRLIAVGEFHFPILAGPPLNASLAETVLDELEGEGRELTLEDLRKHSLLLGTLWERARLQRGRPPVLQNTDGDPLVLLRATFHLADPAAFAAALERVPDVEVDDEGECIWYRSDSPDGERRTILGRIEILGDEALLEVNSRERLARARTWIEQRTGARFVRELEIETIQREDRLPSPTPEGPEVREALARHIEATYLAQLDQPIPMFENRTPRELCKSPAGRAKIERWIRGLPDIGMPGGSIEPPRERLRRELGLPHGKG